MDFSIPVRVVSDYRDPADWALYATTLAAAVAAVIGLWGWVVQQRKKPELRFRWFQPNGQPWTPRDCPVFVLGTEYSISFAFDNIGNGIGESPIVNVMVPEFVESFFPAGPGFPGVPAPGGGGHVSGDATVGLPPHYLVHFLQPPTHPSTPGLTSMYEFRLKVTRHPSPDSNATFHVAVSVEDPQLNPKGRRRIPILVVPIDAYPNVPEPWPGKPIRRVLSRGQAEPKESVRILPGRRVDRRLRIGPASQESG